jgi:glycine hydroxymethyltransferase
MVLCTEEFAESVDKGCPLVIGGPLAHVMAAKAIALTEANAPEFKAYAQSIVNNSAYLAQACIKKGMKVATGGTDNHLFLIDVTPYGLTGRQAESALRDCGVTLNRNSLPYDINGPWYTSGLRIGTAAVTTLGMKEKEMNTIADILHTVVSNTKPTMATSGDQAGKPSKAKYTIDEKAALDAQSMVKNLLGSYAVYPNIDLEFLKASFA